MAAAASRCHASNLALSLGESTHISHMNIGALDCCASAPLVSRSADALPPGFHLGQKKRLGSPISTPFIIPGQYSAPQYDHPEGSWKYTWRGSRWRRATSMSRCAGPMNSLSWTYGGYESSSLIVSKPTTPAQSR